MKKRKILWNKVILALTLVIALVCGIGAAYVNSPNTKVFNLVKHSKKSVQALLWTTNLDETVDMSTPSSLPGVSSVAEQIIQQPAKSPEVIEVIEAVDEYSDIPELDSVDEIEAPVSYYYYDNVPLSINTQNYLMLECKRNGIDPALILAMIEIESGFQPHLVSETADWGLMQINEINHPYFIHNFGITDFLNEENSIFCGIHLIADLMRKYGGNIHMALMAYNMGEGGAGELWELGIYSSLYSEKIARAMTKY